MNDNAENGPFTVEEDSKTAKEGWCISLVTKAGSGDEEWQIETIDEDKVFKDEFEAWKFIVDKGNKKSKLHRKAIAFIERYSPEHLEELNEIFLKKPGKDDLPKVCNRCKKAEAPDNMKLMGIMPSANNTCNWFTCEETKWTLQLHYKTPWRYLDYNNHAEQTAEITIGDFQCPACAEEHRKMISELMKDL